MNIEKLSEQEIEAMRENKIVNAARKAVGEDKCARVLDELRLDQMRRTVIFEEQSDGTTLVRHKYPELHDGEVYVPCRQANDHLRR